MDLLFNLPKIVYGLYLLFSFVTFILGLIVYFHNRTQEDIENGDLAIPAILVLSFIPILNFITLIVVFVLLIKQLFHVQGKYEEY